MHLFHGSYNISMFTLVYPKLEIIEALQQRSIKYKANTIANLVEGSFRVPKSSNI